MAKRPRRITTVQLHFDDTVTPEKRDAFLQALDQAVRRRGGRLFVGDEADGVHPSADSLDEQIRRLLGVV